ncbi:glycosyltransferase [Amycolatopsis sp. VC5-11]|uniref:glycosyltransferase n=1 Tax=Amycolatopsis sp. VC5-11 TaxID=3120156 RepID=UPI00300AB961
MNRTSVVVITHNRREQLRETLQHLVTLPERPPILVVDNASTDGTADLVARARREPGLPAAIEHQARLTEG